MAAGGPTWGSNITGIPGAGVPPEKGVGSGTGVPCGRFAVDGGAVEPSRGGRSPASSGGVPSGEAAGCCGAAYVVSLSALVRGSSEAMRFAARFAGFGAWFAAVATSLRTSLDGAVGALGGDVFAGCGFAIAGGGGGGGAAAVF